LEIQEKIKIMGWKSVVIWECEINELIKDSSMIINKLKNDF
jgi:G:T-mismatch repair DNA endonuclease (very short patch repair protein)